MKTIDLSINKVYISPDLTELSVLLKKYDSVVVIADENVEHLYGNSFNYSTIVVNSSEKDKSYQTVMFIIDTLIKLQADKEVLLLGVGGGITTDICGFVASIYKRGVRFAFVPTTLLAMVDASIGGKNGINYHNYKNLLGVIRQPEWIYIPYSLTASLNKQNFLCGVAEMLKAFIIDGNDYSAAVDFFSQYSVKDIFADEKKRLLLKDFVCKAVRIKGHIVEQDVDDKGGRKILNLGHTFGHAIEHCCPKIIHGEAVSIGMVMSARIAESPILYSLSEDFKRCGLPTALPVGIDREELYRAIMQDKKCVKDAIDFVLLKSIGHVEVARIPLSRITGVEKGKTKIVS